MFAAPAEPVARTMLPAARGPGIGRATIVAPSHLGTARRARWPSVSLARLRVSVPRALALEQDRGTAFLFAPVFLAAGVVAYHALPAEPGTGHLVALAVPPLALAFLLRRSPYLQLAALALQLVAAGALMGKVETLRAGTRMLGSTIATQVTGSVAAVEHMANGRVRLTIDLTDTERPRLRYAPDRVRVTARRLPDGVLVGSTVTGLVRLMPPSGPVRPGSYDFSFESYFDGVGASGFFLRGPTLAAAAPPHGIGWRGTVENFRNAIADRVRDRVGGPAGEVAAALIVGVRAGIPDTLAEAMRTAGIYHVISISGLHMALVAGTLMFLLRGGFALFPGFSARYPVKKLSALVALAGITAYLLISGGEVAAQRSFVMLAVMLVAVLADRAALTMRNLAISAAVVIVLSPHEVVGPSFQMSFAATAALVGAYGAWSELSALRGGTTPDRSIAGRAMRHAMFALAGLAATSLIAGFSTSVFAAYHFQRVSPLSLVANLAAMPIVSVIVMPAAVLAALTMPLGLDGPFLDLMGMGIRWMSAIAEWLAAHSPADSVGIIPGSAVILLTLALLVATLGTTWLRVAAIPPAIAGLILLGTAQPPAALVSEDARLVGVVVGEGALAVNRTRPNAFTLGNWQRAVAATGVVPPLVVDATATARSSVQEGSAKGSDEVPQRSGSGREAEAAVPKGFACEAGLCLARHPSGIVIAHAENSGAMARACGQADLIIVADATARRRCATGRARIITARDLARRGAAAIYIAQSADGRPRLAVRMAVPTPYRPWHAERIYSREARGLAPYQPSRQRSVAKGVSSDE